MVQDASREAALVPRDAGADTGRDAGIDRIVAEDAFTSPPDGCPGSVLTSPLGAPIWSTPLTTFGYLVGPLAANPEGGTYFADDGFLAGGSVDGGPSILALTPCGNVAWRVAWGHPANTGTETFLIVSGSRLVAVESDVEAFDLATGAHLWTADLLGFAAAHGQGGLTADQVLVATPTVAVDGIVYVLFNAPAVVWLLAIDSTGAVSLLATVPIDGDGGFATDLTYAVTYAVAKADGGRQRWEFDASSPGYMLLTAAGELVFSMGSSAVAIASGGERPAGSVWPTPRGGVDQRAAALGQ